MTSPSKQEVLRHFDEPPALVECATAFIHPVAVIQDKPLGLGHAVGLAESVLDADEDYFAVMLPDEVIEPTAAMGEMIRVRQEHGGSVLLAVEVEPSQVSNYGVFDVVATDDVRVKKLWAWCKSLRLRMCRRIWWPLDATLLDQAIFGTLRRITPGRGRELQLTDAIALLISEGHLVHVVVHNGIRHDLGNPAGFIPDSVKFGLLHPKYGPALFADLEVLLEKHRGEVG